jgi:hypothetical protein
MAINDMELIDFFALLRPKTSALFTKTRKMVIRANWAENVDAFLDLLEDVGVSTDVELGKDLLDLKIELDPFAEANDKRLGASWQLFNLKEDHEHVLLLAEWHDSTMSGWVVKLDSEEDFNV